MNLIITLVMFAAVLGIVIMIARMLPLPEPVKMPVMWGIGVVGLIVLLRLVGVWGGEAIQIGHF